MPSMGSQHVNNYKISIKIETRHQRVSNSKIVKKLSHEGCAHKLHGLIASVNMAPKTMF